jgi:hypothetical protein
MNIFTKSAVEKKLTSLILCFSFFHCFGQDNYEIQVYGSETVAKNHTMVELHSNFTFDGTKDTVQGVLPTNHMLHETVEITHGFTNIFEIGFYFFNAIGNDGRTAYVGSHIRPRIMAPKEWNWPVGVSLSLEGGYQKSQYSTDTWTLEIRPIIDKTMGKFYVSVNPTFDKSFKGVNQNVGLIFSPNVKASYNLTKAVAAGFEYYGSIGPLYDIYPPSQQQQQIFFAIDLDWSPDWEFNCGYGIGNSPTTGNQIFKVILGYRFR